MLTTTYRACVACFRESSLQDHHIEPRSQFGSTRREERDADTNKATLCAREHEDIYAKRLFLVYDPGGSASFVRREVAEKFVRWDEAQCEYAGGTVDDFQSREREYNARAQERLSQVGVNTWSTSSSNPVFT